MYAENFYIALYDHRREAINFPYYVDAVDLDIPDPALWEPFGVGNARGLTAYVLRTGRPEHRLDGSPPRPRAEGEVETIGVIGKGEWLGAPLKAEAETIGVVVCQTYVADQRYTDADRDLLAFVGQHIGSALRRVRAVEETRQRNAELALVNEIGSALARQLEFQAIMDLVGDRIREHFDAPSMFIAMYDEATEVVSFPYEYDKDLLLQTEPFKLGPGPDVRGHPDEAATAARHAGGVGRKRGRPGHSQPRGTGDDVVAGRADPRQRAGDRRDRPRERRIKCLRRGHRAASS